MKAVLVQDRQVAEAIENAIARMGLRPGDRMPSETALALALGLTRHGARKGLAIIKRKGRLSQRRGAGTFLVAPSPTLSSVDLAFAVIGPFSAPDMLEELAPFQKAAFEVEFQVQLFDTSPVKQDPAYERSRLERMRDHPVTGILIEPTPYAPSSFDLYDPLRQAGTKVAVLSCPPEQIRDHAVFHLNFQKAGYMACVHLAMRGWRRQCLVSAQTLATQWLHSEFRRGVEEAARDYDIDLSETCAQVRFNEALSRLEWIPDARPPALAGDIGYICSWPQVAGHLRHGLFQAGCRDFGMIAVTRKALPLPYDTILLDPVVRYRRILDYFLDDAIAPTQPVHVVIEPELQTAQP